MSSLHYFVDNSDDPDTLLILAGLPDSETVFEYLIGCWRRLYSSARELNRSAYDKTLWTPTFERLKGLIISYCGMTLEDPSMFPQPDKPVGPSEFLPILLSLNPTAGDPLTTTSKPPTTSILPGDELLPFLNDLANGVSSEQLVDTITPTLSLFFQQWFQISNPDLLGDDWQRYIGAVNTLAQVKAIAALVSLPALLVYPADAIAAGPRYLDCAWC